MTGRVVATRYTMENILKIPYPCSCHCSPVESETYEVGYSVANPYDKIEQLHVMCSNCCQRAGVSTKDKSLTYYDLCKL